MAGSTLGAAPRPRIVNRPLEHAFFALLVAGIVLTVFLGFGKSYLFAGLVAAPLPNLLVHVHAAVYMCWILLLIVQTSLAALGKLRWHRQLGILGLVIASAMVVLGLMVATWSLAAHRYPPMFSPFVFFFGQITTVGFAFPLLVIFAFNNRKYPATHKRLIIIATLSIFDAAITRWPVLAISQSALMTSLVVYSFLLLMVVYDLFSLHRIQKATLWGGLFLIVYREVRIPIGGTSAWAAICYWARSHGVISF
jgi:hypothetical protein